MRKGFATLVLLSGLVFLGLGVRVALFGAAPPVPSGEGVIEGDVLPGETTPSPVGEPFLYGRLTIGHAPTGGRRGSTAHVDRDFGARRVEVQTAEGERAVELPRPTAWQIIATGERAARVPSLDGLEALSAEEARTIGQTIEPPYEVKVRAIRPGDHVIIAMAGGEAQYVYVGDRDALEAQRERDEALRWPAVLLLVAVGAGSIGLSAMLFRKPREEDEIQA